MLYEVAGYAFRKRPVGEPMNSEKFKYDFLRYNHHHVLRPNFLLQIICIYFLKDLFVMVVVAAGAFKAKGMSPEISVLLDLVSPRLLFANFPIALIGYGLINRHPQAGSLPRRIWKNDRWLILLAAIIHTGLLLGSTIKIDTSGGIVVLTLIGLNIAAVAYIFRSKLVADVFAEFPARRDGG